MGQMLAQTPRNEGLLKRGPAVTHGNHGKHPTLADLGLTKRDSAEAQALADMPEPVFEEVKRGTMTRVQVVRDTKRSVIVEHLQKTAAVSPAMPTGIFDVLVIDPPWPMKKIERDVRPNQVELDYPTMTIDALLQWQVPSQFAAPSAHVFLWTTHRFLPLAFECLASWGFTYVLTMVWHKPGGFQPVGLHPCPRTGDRSRARGVPWGKRGLLARAATGPEGFTFI
jgi:MT-A70